MVSKSKFRAKFAPQNLTANTFATLNHGLGEKLVHVSGYDSMQRDIVEDHQRYDFQEQIGNGNTPPSSPREMAAQARIYAEVFLRICREK